MTAEGTALIKSSAIGDRLEQAAITCRILRQSPSGWQRLKTFLAKVTVVYTP